MRRHDWIFAALMAVAAFAAFAADGAATAVLTLLAVCLAAALMGDLLITRRRR